jgi:tetratricopeptide (TPR) repeat protein
MNPMPKLQDCPRIRWKCSALLILFSLFISNQDPPTLWAQNLSLSDPLTHPSGFTANQLVEFAEQLMREGEYFRAITEYRRFLFNYPHDPRRAMMHFRIGLALYRGQRYGEALQTFREVVRRYPGTKFGKQASLWQGESLMRQAQYGTAEQVYTEIIKQHPQDDIGQHARYQLGWALLYQRQWLEASAQFQHLTSENPLYLASQRLAEEVLDGEKLPHKSPLVAGILSGILPGSGQLYNERLGDALLAFFLNGLFVVGIIEAVSSDELAIAGVLSFFEAGWYTGNVYGAINGAHKHNRHAVETFIRNLENRFRVQPPEAHRIVGIRLSFGF